MRLGAPDNPVRQSWLADQGHRLDASPYLSGAYEARKLLEGLPVRKDLLHMLTAGHDGGIYNGPKFRRVYVSDRDHGVPFLGSTDIMEADFSWLPLLRVNDARLPKLSYLRLEPGMTLISCSGTVGRMCYAREDMAGFWSSQDVLKVVANRRNILPGYLYAFLYSRYGLPMITGPASGTMVRHLEPEHIVGLPVPRFGSEVEGRIHTLVEQAAGLRAAFQVGVVDATRDLFTSAGLGNLLNLQWHRWPRDLGFVVPRVDAVTLRARNFSPRAQRIADILRSVRHRTLGDICQAGMLASGARFKRIDAQPDHGAVRLIGQRQGFWLRPEGRWINPYPAPAGIFAKDETVMMAAQGTLGENEVFCRALFITGRWLEYAHTQHFLRVVSGDPEISGAYLFAFLRSGIAFRLFRSMSVGGKQQDIHPGLLRQIPVPECAAADRERIAEIVRHAYRARDEADAKEDEALALLDEAVREVAR